MSSLSFNTFLDSTIDALDMLSLADKLRELREGKKDIEDFLKEVNAVINTTEAALVEAMVAEEMSSFVRADRQFVLVPKNQITAKAGTMPEICAWMKENDLADMVKEQVHAQTLKAWAKETMEEQGALPEKLEPLLNIFEKSGVMIRKK